MNDFFFLADSDFWFWKADLLIPFVFESKNFNKQHTQISSPVTEMAKLILAPSRKH